MQGKSTFIAKVSAARPKIADYPFTTLQPNLGVVSLGEFDSFVMADIPGLIEGAHEGHGLGDRFLRHIERTKILLHLVDLSDASGRDCVQDYGIVASELSSFSPKLAEKPCIVAGTKLDAMQSAERLHGLQKHCESLSLPFQAISSVTGEGIDGPVANGRGEHPRDSRGRGRRAFRTPKPSVHPRARRWDPPDEARAFRRHLRPHP